MKEEATPQLLLGTRRHSQRHSSTENPHIDGQVWACSFLVSLWLSGCRCLHLITRLWFVSMPGCRQTWLDSYVVGRARRRMWGLRDRRWNSATSSGLRDSVGATRTAVASRRPRPGREWVRRKVWARRGQQWDLATSSLVQTSS